MNLLIENKDNLDLIPFAYWLQGKISKYLDDNIDEAKLNVIQAYVDMNDIIKHKDKKTHITLRDILIIAPYNLIVSQVDSFVDMHIDPKMLAPFTWTPLIDIIQLINYGSLSIDAYPIWSYTLQFFADNLQEFYEQFYLERQLKNSMQDSEQVGEE